jgi:uncharacterized protein (DUF1778 family)
MEQRNPDLFSLTLRVPKDTQDHIDKAARTLRMTRTDWIRKAISRNLKYCLEVELPLVESQRIQEVLQP